MNRIYICIFKIFQVISYCNISNKPLSRPQLCLTCGLSFHFNQLIEHFNKSNHKFCGFFLYSNIWEYLICLSPATAIDVISGTIYCYDCQDFIYNKALDKLVRYYLLKFEESLSKTIGEFIIIIHISLLLVKFINR